MKITKETFGPKTYLVWTKEVPMKGMNDRDMWDRAFIMVNDHAQQEGVQVTGPRVGMYTAWNMAEGLCTVGIGRELVGELAVDHEELEVRTIAASPALRATHTGGYEELGKTHQAMMDCLKEGGMTSTISIEEYITDPSSEADSSTWETIIWHIGESKE